MSHNAIFELLNANRTWLQVLEEQRRFEELTGFSRDQANEILQAANAREQLNRMLGGAMDVRDLIDQRNEVLNGFRQLLGGDEGTASLDLIRETHANISAISRDPIAPLALHDGTYDIGGAAGLLQDAGVYDQLRDYQIAGLSDYAGVDETTLASLAVAASHLETLQSAAGFAKVGAAAFAAASLFADPSRIRLGADYDAFLDPFFGDWTQIDALPDAYGGNEEIQRDVLDETDADEALLHVTADEAAALLGEGAYDENGAPILLFGRPTGLVLSGNPNAAAFALIADAERRMRRRVNKVMTAHHGPNWITDRIPEKAKEWKERRAQDENAGLPTHELLEYSYLFDLKIIVQENWSAGFALGSEKPRAVTRPIDALNPHRNYVSHHRPVTAHQLFGIVHTIQKLEPWLTADDEDDE